MATRKTIAKPRAGKARSSTTAPTPAEELRANERLAQEPWKAATSIRGAFESAEDKVTSARSIVRATIAALDSEQCDDLDPHWPLFAAVNLLDEALMQMDRESVSCRQGGK